MPCMQQSFGLAGRVFISPARSRGFPVGLVRPTCRKPCCAANSDLSFEGWKSKKALRWKPSNDASLVTEPEDVDAERHASMAAPLGVDFGKVRIGLATCPGGLISVPLKIVLTRRRPWADLAQELVETAQQQGLDGFIVGLPVTSHGDMRDHKTDSIQGRVCRNFAQTLHAIARPHNLPVYIFDESRTSADAAAALGLQNTSRLKQQGKLDAVAAALLLTAYFERPEAAIQVESVRGRQ